MKPHTCPVCSGHKTVSKPPNVAGDIASWSVGDLCLYACPACNANGIIWEPGLQENLEETNLSPNKVCNHKTKEMNIKISGAEGSYSEDNEHYSLKKLRIQNFRIKINLCPFVVMSK
jgi:hypothetical protein